jgi:hypothetical protein
LFVVAELFRGFMHQVPPQTDCNTECNLQRCSLSTCAACHLVWSPAVRLTPYTILSVYCRPTDWWQGRGRLQGCIGCGQQCRCSRLRWPCGAVPCGAVLCLGWTFSITSGCARVPQLFAERLDLDRVRTDATQHTTRCNAASDSMQRSIRHDATQHTTHKVAPRAYLDNAAATAGTTQDTAYSMLRYSIHRFTATTHTATRRQGVHTACNRQHARTQQAGEVQRIQIATCDVCICTFTVRCSDALE